MIKIEDLKVKIFADGADKNGMLDMYKKPYISGFTTNPTLMRKAGINNYKEFAQDILRLIPDKPISLEVFSDEFEEMERQAKEISSWASNVYVKIPITNTKGKFTTQLIKNLTQENVKVNVTAMMTYEQLEEILPSLEGSPGAYVSIFAGRVADTGKDPLPIMKKSVEILRNYDNVELIWASPRELYNIIQADEIKCHVITVTNSILNKLSHLNKNLD
ncbi:MAG: transaldolase, partial [Candidatus Cloacimonetes bacterium]|nr:transaldolase [Candidatus Cloacimonadota bacterium]